MSPLNMFIELLETLPVVFSLYVCTVVFSVPLGILGALAYTGKNKIVKSVLSVYTWVFRGTPLMLQLFIVYYGIPLINFFGYRVKLDPYSAAVLTFVINYAAYLIEIMRTFKKSVQERIKKLFAQVVKNYTEAFEQKYEILWGDSHPFVDNDEILAKLIGEEVSAFADVKVPEMTTGGEDFSFYQGKVPGLFAFIGTGCPYEWHNPAFQIKDEALYFSINYYIAAVDVMLKK